MPNALTLSVVAPDHSVVEDSAVSIIAPGLAGYFGVLYGHVPILAALKPGIIEYVDPQSVRHFVYVGGGFAEVSPTKVTILADEATTASEIDLADAESRLEHARKALRGEDDTMSRDAALLEVDRAMSRIRAARSHR